MKTTTTKKRIQAARRRRYTNGHRESGSYIETFITQCIICGIILSAVLIIRIIDVPTTNAIRHQFSQTITATADMAEDVRSLGEIIRTIFGEEGDDDITYTHETMPIQLSLPSSHEGDFRIDEDILESIRGGVGNER